jgi:hypothetical protein
LFGEVNVYEVMARLDATKGEFKLPDEMAKTVKFTIKPEVSLTIPNKKKYTFLSKLMIVTMTIGRSYPAKKIFRSCCSL